MWRANDEIVRTQNPRMEETGHNRSFDFTSDKRAYQLNWRHISLFSPSRLVAFCGSPRHPAFNIFLMKGLRVTASGRLICHPVRRRVSH
jgi:hypothetical protein